MIIKPAAQRQFLSAPDPSVFGALIYGPDPQHVRDLADELAKVWLKDDTDPFALVQMSDDDLRSDPLRLEDEWRSMTLIGTGRLIRLRLSGGEAKPVLDVLRSMEQEGWQPAGHLIVEASELRKGAALRNGFEKHGSLAALALYEETDGALEGVAIQAAQALGGRLHEEAIAELIERFGADRALLRSEVEKLVLFVGEGQVATRDDLNQIAAQGSDHDVFDIVSACLNGDLKGLDTSLQRYWQSGKSAVTVLRILQSRLLQILRVKEETDRGTPLESALSRIRPPLFGSRKAELLSVSRRWTTPRLMHALGLTLECEAGLKQTGGADHAERGTLLFRIARAAN